MIIVGIKSIDSSHKGRGIETYTFNLIKSLKKINDLKIQEFDNINELKDVDLVHYTFFDFYKPSLPVIKRFPTVITIHDVIPLIFKDHYPAGILGSLSLIHQKISLLSVSGVITDSFSSKKDILNNLPVKENKIFTVYPAQSENFRKITSSKLLNSVRQKYNLPNQFVVYFSNVNWNKNILGLARACKLAEIDLVVVSKGFEQNKNLGHPELEDLKKFLDEFGTDPKIHILGYVPPDDLVSIVNLASIAASISFYEGFGLPILEAQACGTVVVAANTSSMPEVAGKGAVFVDPRDSAQIANVFIRLSHNKRLAGNLRKLGFENVEKFSWGKTAQEIYDIYTKINNDQ